MGLEEEMESGRPSFLGGRCSVMDHYVCYRRHGSVPRWSNSDRKWGSTRSLTLSLHVVCFNLLQMFSMKKHPVLGWGRVLGDIVL